MVTRTIAKPITPATEWVRNLPAGAWFRVKYCNKEPPYTCYYAIWQRDGRSAVRMQSGWRSPDRPAYDLWSATGRGSRHQINDLWRNARALELHRLPDDCIEALVAMAALGFGLESRIAQEFIIEEGSLTWRAG